MLIVLFLVSHFNFLFVPCGGLNWLPVSFLLHVKYTLSYRIVSPTRFIELTRTDKDKAGFYNAFNDIFGKIGRNASEKVLSSLCIN